MQDKSISKVDPGNFKSENHWYPKALNATIHPMVHFFLNLEKERIITRYCHLHPRVKAQKLKELLDYQCKHFVWGGADLINATSASGRRQMVIIENNSCPSGHKSMPLLEDHQEYGSYKVFLERTIAPLLKAKTSTPIKDGKVAIFYDKNIMENSAYAAVLADILKESVYLVPYYDDRTEHVKIEDGIYYIEHEGAWIQLRAIFRYVTQRPWNRMPLHSKTKILNPIIACLAGGRNKMMAAKAYDLFNAEIMPYGLEINLPTTYWDVSKEEIPLWVETLGGQAVIKIPYSNAGQGVFTIVSAQELDDFMRMDHPYDKYIVQSLIGNYAWSSTSDKGKYYHVGTIPSRSGHTYVNDIRMMVSSTTEGIRPLCIYSRRADKPLLDEISQGQDSWSMLGTNLSLKLAANEWTSETNRLMLMDRRDFNKLGLGLDDLIEAYIQTVLSTIAVDQMCKRLYNSKGRFRLKLFSNLNDDPSLLKELVL